MAYNMLNIGRKPNFVYSIKGKVFTSLKVAAETNGVHKATITRWCKNPKKVDCFRESVEDSKLLSKTDETHLRFSADEIAAKAENSGKDPLEIMLEIANDAKHDVKIRLQAANWAAPYVHPKADKKTGKKAEREEKAKRAGKGRFTASKPPQLRAVK